MEVILIRSMIGWYGGYAMKRDLKLGKRLSQSITKQ
jgi:hypothetical protein